MTEIIDIANEIIEKYCNDMGVERAELSKKCGTKLSKVAPNKVSTSFMRQSLAYFLYHRLPLKATEVGRMIGYADHTTVCLNARLVADHIEINDEYFLPYLDRLKAIAEPLVEHLKFERVSAYWFRNVENNIPKIRSVRSFSV